MGRHTDTYKSKEWQKVRKYVISRSNNLCEKCKAKGIIKPGKEVHHVKELTDKNKTDWKIAYDPSNLIYLCSNCHNDIHDRYWIAEILDPPGDLIFLKNLGRNK